MFCFFWDFRTRFGLALGVKSSKNVAKMEIGLFNEFLMMGSRSSWFVVMETRLEKFDKKGWKFERVLAFSL
jgi:hypothetical protein